MAGLGIQPSAVITYVLVILFGSSSWISVNGTWIQLPLMVNVLPEGWALPSYLAVIVQLAFVGPVFYALTKKLFPFLAQRSDCLASLASSRFAQNFTPVPLIYASLIVAVLCQLLLAIFWNHTSVWSNGDDHSTTLFVLFFFLSMVNCLSNVLYLPYMFRFRPTYTTAYFVGMGFSALVPSVLGLIQGSGRVDCVEQNNSENETAIVAQPILPAFTVGVFYGILSFWLALVVVGFYLLNHLPLLQTERIIMERGREGETTPMNTDEIKQDHPKETVEGRKEQWAEESGNDGEQWSPLLYIYLLLITAWVCALMNGILPSIQSFATLPYGQMTYHLAVTISNLANPVACFIPFFIRLRRVGVVVTVWTVLATALAAYLMVSAAWSPSALLGNESSDVGPAFSVICWTAVTGVLAYLRTVIANVLRESNGGANRVESRLFWCGLFTQGGAFIGALVMFPLVNVLQLFRTAPSCGT